MRVAHALAFQEGQIGRCIVPGRQRILQDRQVFWREPARTDALLHLEHDALFTRGQLPEHLRAHHDVHVQHIALGGNLLQHGHLEPRLAQHLRETMRNKLRMGGGQHAVSSVATGQQRHRLWHHPLRALNAPAQCVSHLAHQGRLVWRQLLLQAEERALQRAQCILDPPQRRQLARHGLHLLALLLDLPLLLGALQLQGPHLGGLLLDALLLACGVLFQGLHLLLHVTASLVQRRLHLLCTALPLLACQLQRAYLAILLFNPDMTLLACSLQLLRLLLGTSQLVLQCLHLGPAFKPSAQRAKHRLHPALE
ncbi:hypothetical protein D3C71_1293590 [compost metagenome]